MRKYLRLIPQMLGLTGKPWKRVIIPTFDTPKRARTEEQIYTEAMAARRSVVRYYMKRSKTDRRITIGSLGYAAITTALVVHLGTSQQTFVYAPEEAAGMTQKMRLIDATYTADKGRIAEVAQWFVTHGRFRSTDPIIMDMFRQAAERRMEPNLRHKVMNGKSSSTEAKSFAIPGDNEGPGWTRDIMDFNYNEITDASGSPYTTWLISWKEIEFYQFSKKTERNMIGTITLHFGVPSQAEQLAGDFDGLKVAAFSYSEDFRKVAEAGAK